MDHLANVGPRSQREGSGRSSLEVKVINWSICSLCVGWGQVCVLVSYIFKIFFFIPKVVLLWSAGLHPPHGACWLLREGDLAWHGLPTLAKQGHKFVCV